MDDGGALQRVSFVIDTKRPTLAVLQPVLSA